MSTLRRLAVAVLAIPLLGLIYASPAQAAWPLLSPGYSLDPIAYEGFTYDSGNLNNRNGGTGWSTAWSTNATPFATGVVGLTYPGLPTDDSAIRATATGGANSSSARVLDDSVDSGVVYFQFLSIFQTSHGGGTPNIRLSYAGNSTGAFGNNDNRPNMAILNAGLGEVGVTTAPLTQLNLTVVQINYDDSITSMWVNPDLSTFNYAAPPTPDAQALNFAPSIDRIEPISRYGSDPSKDIFDEIRIMRLNAPAPTPPVPPVPASAPIDVVAQPGATSANVTWQPPASSGSFPVSTYQVEAAPGGRVCLAAELSCDVTRLLNGTSYTFRVRALTGAGWGPWSAFSNAVTPRPEETASILISGTRAEVRGRPGIVVTGSTEGFGMGAILRPWVRLPGQPNFTMGSAQILVDTSGQFTWQRRTGERATVFVETPDASVRSNRVTIPAR